jgi:hypothetical protein
VDRIKRGAYNAVESFRYLLEKKEYTLASLAIEYDGPTLVIASSEAHIDPVESFRYLLEKKEYTLASLAIEYDGPTLVDPRVTKAESLKWVDFDFWDRKDRVGRQADSHRVFVNAVDEEKGRVTARPYGGQPPDMSWSRIARGFIRAHPNVSLSAERQRCSHRWQACRSYKVHRLILLRLSPGKIAARNHRWPKLFGCVPSCSSRTTCPSAPSSTWRGLMKTLIKLFRVHDGPTPINPLSTMMAGCIYRGSHPGYKPYLSFIVTAQA